MFSEFLFTIHVILQMWFFQKQFKTIILTLSPLFALSCWGPDEEEDKVDKEGHHGPRLLTCRKIYKTFLSFVVYAYKYTLPSFYTPSLFSPCWLFFAQLTALKMSFFK